VCSKGEAGAIVHNYFLIFQIQIKEILHHAKGFFVGDNGGIRINLHEVRNVGCVIRLHMLYDKIIRLALAQNLLDVIEPFVGKVGIYSIHDSCFFIQDHIGIIGHAIRNLVLSFEKVDLMVIYAYVFDCIGDFHEHFLFSF